MVGIALNLPSETRDPTHLDVQDGVAIFRASRDVQQRIEELLFKQQMRPLDVEEEQELDQYEKLDDCLSLVNRLIRKLENPGNLKLS